MVDSRQKGATAETRARDELRKLTGLGWERTPGSGALGAQHLLKGDLYVPGKENIFCIEVKAYKDDHISTKLLTDKSPQFIEWWTQAKRQGAQVSKHPLLIFKHNRSKWFVATEGLLSETIDSLVLVYEGDFISIAKLDDWYRTENPRFIV